MAESKTKPTDASIEEYIASRANEQQREDCEELIALFQKMTKEQPKMWGPSIVGFGICRYTYESGRTGEMPVAGFAIRGRELVLYLDCSGEKQEALLAKLGKHKMSKSCLYFKQLSDLDMTVFKQLVKDSIVSTKKRWG